MVFQCSQRPPLPLLSLGFAAPLAGQDRGVSELRSKVVRAAASSWLGSVVRAQVE